MSDELAPLAAKSYTRRMDVLLHICCGICALETVAALREEGLDALGAWVNPNIEPAEERQRRRAALETVCRLYELPLTGLEAEPFTPPTPELSEERCAWCYRLRLLPTARHAAALGVPFSTTLLYSPYQRHEALRRIGVEVAGETGATFLYRDWRPRFARGQSRARSLGLYRQSYCGCLASRRD